MQIPAALKQGDKVAIVATARKIESTCLIPMIQLLESWSLVPILGKTIGKSFHQFAGTDTERANDLQHMLDNSAIKAIFCARGGYGTVRIVDQLDFTIFQKKPKWLVGFSDITVLHNHIHANCNTITLHALMPSTLASSTQESVTSLHKSLFHAPLFYEFNSHTLNQEGLAEGKLVGGNLSLICSLLGSPSDIDTKGKILFLEDLDEYLYHIDRMMMALKRSGKLADLAGLLIGGMTDMNDNTIPFGQTAYEIIAHHTKEYTYPIAFNCPSGHGNDNRALLIGANATLMVGKQASKLTFVYPKSR